MRKFALVMLLMVFIMPCARAEPLPLAARLDMHGPFERYQSYQMDEASGEWSAHGLIAQQLLGTIEQGGLSGYSGGVCVLYPGVRGNRDLSLMEPVLYVCLVRSSPIKADALSIATGGVRYDFVGKAEDAKIGSYQGERFALPLDGAGLALLRGFADEGGEVCIYSETRVFRTAIREAVKYKNSKLRLEAMSVAAVRDFLPIWSNSYALWDLSAAYWEEDRPKMAAVELDGGEYAEGLPALEPATQCLDTRKGSAVRAYQQLLKDRAFFTAKPASNYGTATRSATKQAQQYYGLLPTGMADRALIELMDGAARPATESEPVAQTMQLTEGAQQATPGIAYALDGRMAVRVDRAWEAYSLSPSRSADYLDRLWPGDRSNRLYIADGEIINLSTQSVQLPSLLQGYVQMNGIRYPCTIQCERDEGYALGTSLLPMDKRRLVIVCEVPRGGELEGCALLLEVDGGEDEKGMLFGEAG